MRKEYRTLLKNTGLFAVGGFASSLLGMLFIPLYTAVLTPEEYGISDLITTAITLLLPFATVALADAVLRFAHDGAQQRRTVYSSAIYIFLAGFLAVLALSPLIRKTTIGPYLSYFLVYYAVYCLHNLTASFVKGMGRVQLYSICGLLQTGVFIACNLLFLLVFEWGLRGYLLATIYSCATSTVVLFFG